MIKIKLFLNFEKKFKKLKKKNKNILKDIRELSEELQENPKLGIFLGNDIYKIRVANSSKNIGKSGGFRVITYFLDEEDFEENKTVYLLEIYEKNFIENIATNELIKLVKKEFENIANLD